MTQKNLNLGSIKRMEVFYTRMIRFVYCSVNRKAGTKHIDAHPG